MLLLALIVAGCGEAAPAAPARPARPMDAAATAAPPTATPAVRPTAAGNVATSANGDSPGSGLGTVEIGGETYELLAGEVCSFDFGAQLGMASRDAQTTLSVMTGPSGTGAFLLTTQVEAGEIWVPTEPVAWDVDGSRGSWNSTMREETGREEPVTISVNCED